jgi:hypothetical protein
MKTPLQYKNQLVDLGIDQIPAENISPAEAKQNLEQLEVIHARIRDTETGLNMDIHALRSQFQGRLAALGINSKRKVRSGEEQRVEEESDIRLAPYEEVKAQIQTLLKEIEEKRALLDKKMTHP